MTVSSFFVFLAGILAGVGLAFLLKIVRFKTAKQIAAELYDDAQTKGKEQIDEILRDLESRFGSLSLNALSKATDQFLKLASSKFQTEREVTDKDLEGKKTLIDQQLVNMNDRLEKVSDLISDLEKDREEKFGELTNQLKNTNQQTAALLQTTGTLKEALASSKTRGQWGERMAEDVLRLAGFVENVNYLKQKTIEGIGSKPDITFLLPKSLRLNMDVKFPYDNYMRFLSCDSENEREKFKSDFFKDVKVKLKEVTSRDYINSEQNTLDYVILFVPNERIYSFIHEQDPGILDAGLKNKVVFCSPITLFAVLAIIRQAVDNFSLEQTSNQILSLLGSFKMEWIKFMRKLETVGKRIDDTQREYQILTTARKNKLERPLNKIESLRRERGLPISEEEITELPADTHDQNAEDANR